HRILVLRNRPVDPAVAAALMAKRLQVDQAFTTLRALADELGPALQYSAQDPDQQKRAGVPLTNLLQAWQELKRSADQLPPEEVAARHAELLVKVRGLIAYIGNTSELILDPELDSYYLMDAMLVGLPQVQ